ncbi:MAG TPA: hypothetical protein VFR78_21965 [Pyrinomonadaceae bacterium]|nr:hypothetical protein [Pyrinomonadaceae bacterium]
MSTTMGQTGLGGGTQTGRERDEMGMTGGSQMGMAGSHTEGTVARTIEQQTAKLPSDVFLWAAFGAIGTSAVLQLMGKKQASLFVGDWVAPFLLFGVYNKIVKTQGSDKYTGH